MRSCKICRLLLYLDFDTFQAKIPVCFPTVRVLMGLGDADTGLWPHPGYTERVFLFGRLRFAGASP